MTFSVRLQKRNFTDFIIPPTFEMRPLRWSWKSPGGPEYAEIAIDGSSVQMWDALNYLRCPVTIYSGAVPVWWGFVQDVGYADGPVSVTVSLKSMSNKVTVAYSLVATGSTTVGTRATTAAASDTTSTGEYGTKELLATMDDATSAQAEAVRDLVLAQYKYPLPITQSSGVRKKELSIGRYSRGEVDKRGTGRLVCMGWWHTLGWRYYSDSGTASTVTTTQISDILTSVGEFVATADIVDASGVSSSEYREGDHTALTEIESLLQTPTSGGDRLTASVTRDRQLRVELEGDSGDDDWLITRDGIRDRWGNMPMPGTSVLGWAQLRNVVPASANLTYMGAPSPLYITENEFDANDYSYRWTPRGTPSPWDIAQIEAG